MVKATLKQWAVFVIQVILCVYLGFAVLLFFAQDYLVFPGYSVKESSIKVPNGYVAEKLTINADGLQLEGTLLKPTRAGNFSLVLAFMGNDENANSYAGDISDTQASWFLVNYRGYGGQLGKPSEEALKADALRWYDELKEHTKTPANSFFVMGKSIGTGVAVYLASQRPVAGVILATPYEKLETVAQEQYPLYPTSLFLRTKLDSLSLAPKIKAPALFLVAAKDKLIPMHHAETLRAAWGSLFLWREFIDADHDNISLHPMFWYSIGDFIAPAEPAEVKPAIIAKD